MFSTNTDHSKLTSKDKLKRTEYGMTVVIFHIGISLFSLGGFYLAVTRYVLHRSELLMAGCLNERISSYTNYNMRFCSTICDSLYIIVHLLEWCRFGWVQFKFRRSGSRSQQFCNCICSTQDWTVKSSKTINLM
jgi:hypothetical protein